MDFNLINVYNPKLFQNQIHRISYDIGESDVRDSLTSLLQSNKEETISKIKNVPKITGFLRIKIPIAGLEGDFRMLPGTAKLEGRACETEVQVLQFGFYQVCDTLIFIILCFIYLLIYWFVSLFILFCLFVCLFISLFVCLFACLSIYKCIYKFLYFFISLLIY